MLKKIFQNTAMKMITALAVVGILSGIVLVFVYTYSMPKIEMNVKNETRKAIESIYPGTSKVEKIGEEELFKVMDSKGAPLGYAFIAEGNGYQGAIRVLAGISLDFEQLKGIEILESQETPGLGAEIANDPFKGQFSGLQVTHKIEYLKNKKPDKPYQIEAITGATISSRAVVNILNKSIENLRKATGKK